MFELKTKNKTLDREKINLSQTIKNLQVKYDELLSENTKLQKLHNDKIESERDEVKGHNESLKELMVKYNAIIKEHDGAKLKYASLLNEKYEIIQKHHIARNEIIDKSQKT